MYSTSSLPERHCSILVSLDPAVVVLNASPSSIEFEIVFPSSSCAITLGSAVLTLLSPRVLRDLNPFMNMLDGDATRSALGLGWTSSAHEQSLRRVRVAADDEMTEFNRGETRCRSTTGAGSRDRLATVMG